MKKRRNKLDEAISEHMDRFEKRIPKTLNKEFPAVEDHPVAKLLIEQIKSNHAQYEHWRGIEESRQVKTAEELDKIFDDGQEDITDYAKGNKMGGIQGGTDEGMNLPGAKALHYWQYGREPTNFDSMLITLLQKADSTNRRKIAVMWPEIYRAWSEWNACESQDAYFERYGLPLHGRDYS